MTETCVNVEQYGGERVVLVCHIAIVCKCETHTKRKGFNPYGQPQVVAEGCDVAIPFHAGVAGLTYKHVVAGSKLTVVILYV